MTSRTVRNNLVRSVLNSEYQSASEIAEKVNMSPSHTGIILKGLVEIGEVELDHMASRITGKDIYIYKLNPNPPKKQQAGRVISFETKHFEDLLIEQSKQARQERASNRPNYGTGIGLMGLI